jgi:hypothetical protein
MTTTWLLFNWNQRDGMPLLVRSHPALKNQGRQLLGVLLQAIGVVHYWNVS